MGTVINYYPIENYTVKCRLYPNKMQAEQIDNMIDAVRLFHNAALHDALVNKNPAVLREMPEKNNPEAVIHFIDFYAMKKKEYLDTIYKKEPRTKRVPHYAIASLSSGAIFDMQKAWKATGKHPIEHFGNTCINKDGNKMSIGIRYFNKTYKCRSFTTYLETGNFVFTDNPKVIKLKIKSREYRIDGAVKIKGFNNKLRFDNKHEMGFQEWLNNIKTERKRIKTTVSKDNCGEYYVSILLPLVYKPIKESDVKVEETGIDVGEIDIMTTYDGEHIKKYGNLAGANKYVGKERKGLERLNRKLSRREGPKNIEWRKKSSAAKKNENEILKPSNSYSETELRYNKINRKLTRQRKDFYSNAVMDVLSRTENVSVEGLRVKDLLERKNVKKKQKA